MMIGWAIDLGAISQGQGAEDLYVESYRLGELVFGPGSKMDKG
jgi:hypothetical protein